MSPSEAPELFLFHVTEATLVVLQELQVILGIDDHYTPGQALETTLVWYDDATAAGSALRFAPPAPEEEWQPYTRKLEIDPAFPPKVEVLHDRVRVEAEGLERLIGSEALLRLTTAQGLEQMVRLKAEEEIRRQDDWTIEIETNKGAVS